MIADASWLILCLLFPSLVAPHPELRVEPYGFFKGLPERTGVRIGKVVWKGMKFFKCNPVITPFRSCHLKIKEIGSYLSAYFFRIIDEKGLVVKKLHCILLGELIGTMIRDKTAHPGKVVSVKKGPDRLFHRHNMCMPSGTQVLKNRIPQFIAHGMVDRNLKCIF